MPRMIMVNKSGIMTKNYTKQEVLATAISAPDTGVYDKFVGVKLDKLDDYLKDNRTRIDNAIRKIYRETAENLTRVFVGKTGDNLQLLVTGLDTKTIELPLEGTGEAIISALKSINTRHVEIYVMTGQGYTQAVETIIKAGIGNDHVLTLFKVDKECLAYLIIQNVGKIKTPFKYLTPASMGVRNASYSTLAREYDDYISEINKELKETILTPYDTYEVSEEVEEVEVLTEEPLELPTVEDGQLALLEEKLAKLISIEVDFNRLNDKFEEQQSKLEEAEEALEGKNKALEKVEAELKELKDKTRGNERKIEDMEITLRYDSKLSDMVDSMKAIEHAINGIEDVTRRNLTLSKAVPTEYLIDDAEFNVKDVMDMNEELRSLELSLMDIDSMEDAEDEGLGIDMDELGELPPLDDLVDMSFLEEDYVSGLLKED